MAYGAVPEEVYFREFYSLKNFRCVELLHLHLENMLPQMLFIEDNIILTAWMLNISSDVRKSTTEQQTKRQAPRPATDNRR